MLFVYQLNEDKKMEQDWQNTHNAAMDSVNLLNAGKPAGQSDDDWTDCVKRNVDHLKIIVGKEWPEGYDLTAFNAAIDAND
jgi:hypothetical protein